MSIRFGQRTLSCFGLCSLLMVVGVVTVGCSSEEGEGEDGDEAQEPMAQSSDALLQQGSILFSRASYECSPYRSSVMYRKDLASTLAGKRRLKCPDGFRCREQGDNVACFKYVETAGGEGSTSAPPAGSVYGYGCVGRANAFYCGGNFGVQGSPDTLYYCENGYRKTVRTCDTACVAYKTSENDACATSDLAASCRARGYAGGCAGNKAFWWENGQCKIRNCTESGQTCGLSSQAGVGYLCQ